MDVPGRIPRERGARERFARAVDQGVSHLDDQEFGEELAIVSALRRAGADGAPDRAARERIAARIGEADREPELAPVPATTVTVLEAAAPADTAAEATVTVPRPRSPEAERERSKPRLPVLVAAAFCLVLALAGIGTTMSSDSLPGDVLYQVKRAQESASLQLTLDEGDRARKQLEYAGDRLVELALLAERTEPGTGHEAFRAALADFGTDARVGVAQLTAIATTTDGSQLDLLRNWVETQSDRLAELRAALPAEVAAHRAETAVLLREIDERATALSGRMNCYQITSGESDELGVLPSEQDCAARPGSRAGGSATPTSVGPAAPGGDTDDQDPAPRDATLVGRQPTTSASPDPAPHTSSAPARTTSTYVPREWLPAPAPTSVSRPRLPSAPTEPPAVVSVPPLLPEVPGTGIG
ncbi:hypothetical protein SAMN05216266_103153 [Amycolatopsis marina]|uniref:DUF5667 domain-containing protein n=1 Tax=Amycolatopsis marina TaxID=490629 RepID=A0A1I0XEN8_9PSEU|nr:DUF5667 domain-containing protein [Amycolatopsis marina]SFA99495.1 hypothetical protein SAMN05216266_103153 [Amycolatopsis marina]